MSGSNSPAPSIEEIKALNGLHKNNAKLQAVLGGPPEKIDAAYSQLQHNLKVMELFFDGLEKTILVGGLRYFANVTNDVTLRIVSQLATFLLCYYVALRLAESVWLPISSWLARLFRLSFKWQILITLFLALIGGIGWFYLFDHIISILTHTHF